MVVSFSTEISYFLINYSSFLTFFKHLKYDVPCCNESSKSFNDALPGKDARQYYGDYV